MSGQSDDLDKLLASVADGEAVDWDSLEKAALDESSRDLLRRLRLIAEVADVHRSQVDEVDEDAALTAPVGGPEGTPLRTPERRVWPQVSGTRGMTSAPSALGIWGHLLLVRKIGEGSFGEVYHAHDTWLDHPVALKLLKRDAEERVPPAQLLHEARKLARVRHPNVVTVHGADRHNGRVGFWMDFVDGETLSTRVAKGRLSAGEAVSVGQEVCRALAAVHQAKLIHRDVKAQNVMRAHDGGRIILMDFGAGEFVGDSTSTHAQGTPLYLAPELLRGKDATVRSDIYAVGVLLYHLVTGRFPVEGASPAALLESHTQGRRRRLRDERPDLPESFITIVERAIDPDPARRYGSAGEMEAKLSGEPSTKPVSVSAPMRPPALGRGDFVRGLFAIAAALVGLIAVLGFVSARFFDVALRVDPAFSLGMADVFAIGLTAMLPYFVMWLLAAALLAGLMGVAWLLPGSLWTVPKRLLHPLDTGNPVTTAAIIVLLAVVSWYTVNWVVFDDFLSPMWDLSDNLAAGTDLSLLGSANRQIHRYHYFVSAYGALAMALVAWRWFPHLERRSNAPAAIRAWKWGAVAVAIAFLTWGVLPRRLVWERYPVVQFEQRAGLVIGSTGDELLVFSDEPGRPLRRMTGDDVRRTGETRFLFDPAGPN